jgi:predicted kinase
MPVSQLIETIATESSGKPTVVFLVGPPASGKSSISQGLESKAFTRLSMDAIRGKLYGNEGTIGDEKLVKETLVQRYAQSLADKRDVFLDNTNCHRPARMSLSKRAREAGYEHIVFVIMRTPLRTCLARNRRRNRVVPDHIIRVMHAQMNGGHKVLKIEGRIIEVRPGSDTHHVKVKL